MLEFDQWGESRIQGLSILASRPDFSGPGWGFLVKCEHLRTATASPTRPCSTTPEEAVKIWGRFLVIALFSLVICPSLTAQVRKKIPVPKIDRQWEEGEHGLWQWKRHEVKCGQCRGVGKRACEYCEKQDWPNCPACKGKKTTTCRVCAGTGKFPDPLISMMDPYCQGVGWHACILCGGDGSYPVQGGGKKDQPCGSCKKIGSFPCQVCKGKHLIPVVKVGKKGIGNASSKELKKARKILQTAHDGLMKVSLTSKESKSIKAILKPLKKAAKIFPALKGMEKTMKANLKGIRKGSAYTRYPEMVLSSLSHYQDQTLYVLRYQLLLIDLCMKRAEHNEDVEAKLAAEKKAKKSKKSKKAK
jgi:hypothetical protein